MKKLKTCGKHANDVSFESSHVSVRTTDWSKTQAYFGLKTKTLVLQLPNSNQTAGSNFVRNERKIELSNPKNAIIFFFTDFLQR